MGAQQSSNHEGDPLPATKTCYYELLDVERDASDDEIKKAYKRKALLLHPDRNFGDVENATRRFAEVQSAYEVLSDPQERAWYDSHRDAILRGADPEGMDSFSPEFNNVKLTSTQDILSLIGRFNATVPFNDEPTGFFGIASETFTRLADEERVAGEYNSFESPEYPPFGESSDSYDAIVKPFYAAWAGFATRKTFAWKDKYRLSEAPDRRVRRLMEKENKKLRDDAIREFNDAVRFLVTFVRKRDTRYLPNRQSDAERQAALRSASAAQAARSRAANLERLQDEPVATWAQPQGQGNGADGDFSEVEEESEVEHIECVVCDKVFKSEKSFEAHEKSKKHIKAVQQLQRRMQKEGKDLDIDPPAEGARNLAHNSRIQASPTLDSDATGEDMTAATTKVRPTSSSPGKERVARRAVDVVPEGSSDGRQMYESDLSIDVDVLSATDIDDLSLEESAAKKDDAIHPQGEREPEPRPTDSSTRRPGMAKEKRAKKAARMAMESSAQHTCGVCQETFPSKTKLFNHIRQEGHAELKSASRSSATSGGNRKGR